MIRYDILGQSNTNLISVTEYVFMAMTLNITMVIMFKVIIQTQFKQNKILVFNLNLFGLLG